MSYFGDGYAKLSFPIANPDAEVAGFREAQRGALFAIGAHFTARTDPAIVTMPTGSGKTAVLQATAFLLRATRTLVIDAPRFYNVGMRTRQLASATESYRMITGPHADEAIRPGDARLFDRGHVFGSATEDGAAITIGLSSASKIWSNRNLPLFELLEWCGRVAAKLHDRAAAVTGSKLDMLQTGAVADAIPAPVMLADWEDRRFHLDPPSLTYEVGGRPRSSPASEAELVVEDSDDRRVNIRLECAGLAMRFVFDVRGIPQFAYPLRRTRRLSTGSSPA